MPEQETLVYVNSTQTKPSRTHQYQCKCDTPCNVNVFQQTTSLCICFLLCCDVMLRYSQTLCETLTHRQQQNAHFCIFKRTHSHNRTHTHIHSWVRTYVQQLLTTANVIRHEQSNETSMLCVVVSCCFSSSVSLSNLNELAE